MAVCRRLRSPMADRVNFSQVQEMDDNCVLLLPPEQQHEMNAENEELMPMVFLCTGCKRPVGDTESWVSNDEEMGCILLSRASAIVSVDEEQQISKMPGERGCYILGSSEKQAHTDEEPLTLESRSVLEATIQRTDTVLNALETRLIALELSMASLRSKV